MRGTSKVVLGATLVMMLSLALVLGLVLVLLAELYCSLLLSRRRLRNASTSSTTIAAACSTAPPTSAAAPPPSQPSQFSDEAATPASYLYSEGVLHHVPRNLLFPAASGKHGQAGFTEEQKFHSDHIIQIAEAQIHDESSTEPRCLTAAVSPSTSFELQPVTEELPVQVMKTAASDQASHGEENLMYISNPIFDEDFGRSSGEDTWFETPNSSPSRLENECSSSCEEERGQVSPTCTPSSPLPTTPPLTPMKKLPAEACSVSLRDARSLETSGSDSSSSSGTPGTSPSW